MIDSNTISIILSQLKENHSLPLLYSKGNTYITEAIHLLTDYDNVLANNQGREEDLSFATYKLFNNALIDMLNFQVPTSLSGRSVTASNISDKLNEYIEYDNDIYSIKSLQEVSINDYIKASTDRRIKYHLEYMMSCIWNAM